MQNFDTCWPDDQLKAKGLVASIREVVNQKDAFTRMNNEREEERRQRVQQQHTARDAKQKKLKDIETAKAAFYALFAPTDNPQARGKKLESALNEIFRAYGILVQEAFHLVGSDGEGIVEQVDGVIEHKNSLYFVEMKWHREPVGKGHISEHLVRLIGRAEARGFVISASDYTEPAIHTAREFLQHKLVALIQLNELVQLLERGDELSDFLTAKVNAAQIHKNPFFQPSASTGQ